MIVFIRHAALVIGSVSLVFACSSSETTEAVKDAGGDGSSETTDTVKDAGGDAAPTSTCELRDGGCGEGCCPQPGNRYDPARECHEAREQVIGCAPMPASTSACGLLGVVGCFVTPDGTFYTPGLAPGWPGATACDETLRAKVTSGKSCPTADAGVD